MYKTVIFDLDGTLSESGEGIMRCVQHALRHFGIEVTDEDELRQFIGPPPIELFRRKYGMSPEQADEAMEVFRTRFRAKGIYENKPYPGTTELLEKLKAAGVALAVATSKPQPFMENIVERYGWRNLFDMVAGSEFDGTRGSKTEVLAYVVEKLGIPADKKRWVAMVGDRKYDMLAAKSCGVTAVGVRYGYADPGELEAAGADVIADTVPQLLDCLLK